MSKTHTHLLFKKKKKIFQKYKEISQIFLMNENPKRNDNPDDDSNNDTKDSNYDIISDENCLQPKTPLKFQNNKDQETSKEIDQPQTQFSMEIIQTTSPSDITPSTVQSYNPNEKKEVEKFHICDACCSDAPIRTANARIGPYSTYSVCFLIF